MTELLVLYCVMGVFTTGWSLARPHDKNVPRIVVFAGSMIITVLWPFFLGKYVGDWND